MTQVVLRRLLSAIPTLAAVATLVFSLIHLIPGDPVLIMLGEGAQPTDVEGLRREQSVVRTATETVLAHVDGVMRQVSARLASGVARGGHAGGTYGRAGLIAAATVGAIDMTS